MEIQVLPHRFTVCQVTDYSLVNLQSDYVFIEKTPEENSLVCPTKDVPANTLQRDDGWRAFRIQGVLDFSLIGILSNIAAVFANHEIPIFAVSTYNTDYILIQEAYYQKGLYALQSSGYKIANC